MNQPWDDAMRMAIESGTERAKSDEAFKRPAEMIKKANRMRVDETDWKSSK